MRIEAAEARSVKSPIVFLLGLLTEQGHGDRNC
jgi:hypothetical protein